MALYVNLKPSRGPRVEDSVFMPHEDVIAKPQMSLEEYLVESFGGGELPQGGFFLSDKLVSCLKQRGWA